MKKLFLLVLLPIIGITSILAQCNANIHSTNIYCNGSNEGTATVSSVNGTAPFTYLWSNDSITQTISHLIAGNYTVTITDALSCTVIQTVTIMQPPALVASIGGFSNSCGQCNGYASAIATGGTQPYTYMWSSAPHFTTPYAYNLCAGMYSVTIVDSYNCATATSVTITDIPTTVAVSFTNIVEPTGCCNGSVDAIATGGNSPYTFQWNNGVVTPSPTMLCPGNTSVTVTDATGCSATNYVMLSGNNTFQIVVDTLNNINCANNTTGTISVHAIGGSGSGYSYYWSGMGITSTQPTIHTNIPGIYTIQVSDINGCTITLGYEITNSNNIYASVITTNANCSNNGTAIVDVQGANPPYSFLWSDSLHQTNDTAIHLAAGHYSVTVTDANGCNIVGLGQIQLNCLNVIKGRVYSDLNQNCIQDAGEPGIANNVITFGNWGNNTFTDSSGNYTISTSELNTTIYSVNYSQPYFTPTCPSTSSVDVTFTQTGGDTATVNFGYYANPNYFDLTIHPGWTNGNPGFEKTYWFLYENFSANTINATVRFVYDPVLQYDGCTQNGVHNAAQHEIVWTFNNLAPGSYWNWNNRPTANFTVPAAVSITDSLHTYFEITPISGDSYPFNNTLDVYEPVTGSHDPNSKSVIPKGSGSEGFILQSDSLFLYTIHFQNDGNDTAFTVVVADTLSAYLDPTTFVAGASSHPYSVEMSGTGIITFRFDHIMLPDSNVNEPASNGYVNYSIKQKHNNSIGTVIKNTAYIYFDFNEAIITNTTKNTIASPVFIKELECSSVSVKVFPNPFTDKTNFTILTDILKQTYKLQVFDVFGKTVLTKENMSAKQFEISSEGMSQGVYFYNIYSEQQIIASGKLIIE